MTFPSDLGLDTFKASPSKSFLPYELWPSALKSAGDLHYPAIGTFYQAKCLECEWRGPLYPVRPDVECVKNVKQDIHSHQHHGAKLVAVYRADCLCGWKGEFRNVCSEASLDYKTHPDNASWEDIAGVLSLV